MGIWGFTFQHRTLGYACKPQHPQLPCDTGLWGGSGWPALVTGIKPLIAPVGSECIPQNSCAGNLILHAAVLWGGLSRGGVWVTRALPA